MGAAFMQLTHTMCAVESYRVTPHRPGAFGDEIIVEGWFLTHSRIRSMKVAFADGTELEIADCNRGSPGIAALYSETFGKRAETARFLLVEPVGMRRLDYRSAVFQVALGEAERYELGIGHLFSTAERDTYSDEQSRLVMSFESCGDNCEFGLVQRRIGVERLSFLRYAGVGDVFALARGIAEGFQVLERPDAVSIIQHGHEWMASIPALGLAFHTGRSVGSISFERILAEESSKLAFLAQKFLEDCESSEKIFVYRVLRDERGGPDGIRGMDALFDALRTRGPVDLLWVNTADEEHPHGTIVMVREGLYRGFIDHLAPHWNAFDYRPDAWLELLGLARETVLRDRTARERAIAAQRPIEP